MINLIKKKIKFLFFIFNYYLKLFFESLYLLNKKKVKSVDAVFAYTDYTNQEGAYGYLHYLIKMISKYSRFSYKNLNSLNYKFYRSYNIKKLLLFFHQSLGFDISAKLIESSKKIIFFVNDNNIFCKKSYNVHKGKECFRCLKKYNPYKDCNHFPFNSLDKSYLNFLSILKKKSKNILFVCHSSGHKKIIKSIYPLSKILKSKHYSFKFKNIKTRKIKYYNYDFLFHANAHEAKGYDYFLKLANINLSQRFFVPNLDPCSDKFKNVEFNKVRWNSGLIEKIYNSKIILCPSFWTANFEGSVIKTMLMGKCCAVINNINSFSADIPNSSIIKLSGSLKKDAYFLKKKIKNISEIEAIGKNARLWALKYIKDKPKKEIIFLDNFLKD
jgi:hypothetical protein